jgi:hypothetical protein
MELFQKPKHVRFAEFNSQAFETQLTEVTRLVKQLFDHSQRRFSPIAGESSGLRAGMSRSVTEIGLIMKSAEWFETRVKSMKKWTLRFNYQLRLVHEQLQLPYEVRFAIVDRNDGSDWAIIDSNWVDFRWPALVNE